MTTGTIVLILQSVVAMSTIVVNTKLNKYLILNPFRLYFLWRYLTSMWKLTRVIARSFKTTKYWRWYIIYQWFWPMDWWYARSRQLFIFWIFIFFQWNLTLIFPKIFNFIEKLVDQLWFIVHVNQSSTSLTLRTQYEYKFLFT